MSAGRGKLTPREWAAMLLAQGGKCCVRKCENAPTIGEHSTPNAFKAGKPDQLMCAPCHKIKTPRDIRNIAKAKRIANGRTQADKRKAKGGTRIPARPWQWRGLSKNDGIRSK